MFLVTLPPACPKSSSPSGSSYSPLTRSFNTRRAPYVPCIQPSGFLLSKSKHRVWRAAGTASDYPATDKRDKSQMSSPCNSPLPAPIQLPVRPSYLCQPSLLSEVGRRTKLFFPLRYESKKCQAW